MLPSPRAHLDHLVVAARTLEDGQAWLEGRLQVPLQAGGEHAMFGTHNRLLGLGHTAYLEVIAVNPAAPPPARPRWFGLDTPAMQRRLESGPALIHWVAAVPSLVGWPDVLALSRGDNRWQLTVPPDGALPLGGVAPSLIAWQTPPPSARLPESGCRITGLRLGHPQPDLVRARLNAIDFQGEAEVYEAPQPKLGATLETPGGLVAL
jgi:Glyoxalase-like domain